jgi:predicted RNA binding protein YcfA (HicA-like mRNA interferase family)
VRVGFYINHQTGSHVNLRHGTKTHLHVVVPSHAGDIAPKTLKSILAQAEIDLGDFVAMLGK